MTDLALYVECPDAEQKRVDLAEVWAHGDVIDEDSMHALLVHHIALWALENGHALNDISGLIVEDEDGQELSISYPARTTGWIREVTQLHMWLISSRHHCEDEAILAYIDNVGWRQFDFESGFREAEDKYSQGFDGDYEEFARERMDEQGESLSEHLESRFDYAGHGEDLVEEFSVVEWGYEKFLFHQ